MVSESRSDEEGALNGHSTLVPRVTEGIKRADDKIVTLVKQRPIAAISGALLVGYVLGRLLGRRG